MSSYLELSERHSRRRRRALLVGCLVVGSLLGVAGAGGAGWIWARSYLESKKLWADVSEKLGVELSATSTQAGLLPPTLVVRGLEAAKDGAKLAQVGMLVIGLDPLALLTTAADFDVVVQDVKLLAPAAAKGKSESPVNTTGVPKPMGAQRNGAFGGPTIDFPLRRLSLKLRATHVQPPTSYLPQTDVALDATVTSGARGGLKVEASRFAALGLVLKSSAELDGNLTGPFAVELPAGQSFVSGKLSGKLGRTLGDLKVEGLVALPSTPLELPKGLRWEAGGKSAALEGRASLSGNVSFVVAEQLRWTADAAWDLNLTDAGLRYGPYAKPAGKVARASGRFKGTATDWKLTDVVLAAGPAVLKAALEAAPGQGTHVSASAEPFEIGELATLALPKGGAVPRVSGKASGKVDVRWVNPAEPSGSVALNLDGWSVDGASAIAVAGIKGMDAGGKLLLKGKIAANLERGAFKDGTVKLVADASDLDVAMGDSFEKRAGSPLVLDLLADGAGKSLAIRSVRIQGPGGLKLAARGSLADLKDYNATLTLAESRLPLKVLGEFFPKLTRGRGLIELSGTIQGSLKHYDEKGLFAKLACRLKGVEVDHPSVAVRKLSGEIELILSDAVAPGADDAEADSDAEPGRTWLVRLTGVSAIVAPKLAAGQVEPLSISTQGKARLRADVLTGDVTGKVAALNLEPWLAQAKSDAARGEPETEAAPAAGPPSAKAKPGAPPLDLRRSKFHLTLSTPKLRVPYADFTDAQAELQVGAGGTASAPDVTVLRVAGKALGGDLSLKARLWLPSRVELESSGQGIDMERLMQVVSRASGKDLSQEIFGRGDVDVKGGLTDGMATADFKGKAEIRDGGFRFLPLPKSLMEKLSAVPALAARMNADAGTGKVTDSLEKARATFHLKGDRLDLQVEAADARMGTTKASGFVTLAGHCELAGTIVPSQKLLGDALHGTDATIPFVSQGEGWACGFKPELEKLALSVGKSKVKELLESKKGELGDGLKKSLKGLFGK